MNSIYQKEIALKIKSISTENLTWLKDNTEDLINNIKLLVFTLENQDNKKLVKEVKDKLQEKIKDFKNIKFPEPNIFFSEKRNGKRNKG